MMSPHLVMAWTSKLGWDWNPGLGADLALAIAHLPMTRILVWTVYVAAYLTTAVLILRKDPRVLWTASLAVALDFGYWAMITLLPLYTSVYSPAFRIGDVIINLASLSVLGGAIALSRYWRAHN